MVEPGERRAVPYYRYAEAWTDERLDDPAASLRPLPAQMARVEERLESVERRLDDLIEEMRLMRQDMSAMQRQFAQQGWAMAIALIGALIAVIVSVA
jgi:chromosome segregation ATPase